MSNKRLVWSDEQGDQRKNKPTSSNSPVNESQLLLHIRRLTSGKGRTVIEVSELPNNKAWCKGLAKEIKKALGVGGTYKNQIIEIHGEKIDQVTNFLNTRNIPWKKTGG